MPEMPNTFACDVCGATKKETNHWWMLWINARGQVLAAVFDVRAWRRLKQTSVARAVACGEEHGQLLFSRALQNTGAGILSFAAPSQRPVTRSADTPGCAENDEQARVPAPQGPPAGKEEA